MRHAPSAHFAESKKRRRRRDVDVALQQQGIGRLSVSLASITSVCVMRRHLIGGGICLMTGRRSTIVSHAKS